MNNVKIKRFTAFFTLAVAFVAAFASIADAQPSKRRQTTTPPPAPAPALVTLLPASEAAMTFDAARFVKTGMPMLFGANSKMLAEIESSLDKMKASTGIDARNVTEVAAGMSNLRSTDKGFDGDFVMFARGGFASADVIAAARKAGPEAREEKVGDRTMVIVKPKPVSDEQKAKIDDKVPGGIADKLFGATADKEMAIAAFDAGTIVAGTPESVRAALGDGPRVGADVLAMVAKKPGAMMSFGAKTPTGLAMLIDLDDDELGATLRGVRELSGSMDMTATAANLSIAARTAQPEQAKSLLATLTSLKGLAVILKTSKRADQQIYARIVDGVKLTQTGNEVTIDATASSADLNAILK